MMFMDTTTKDFDKLAEETANQFLTEGTPLTDAIVKVASRESLNPVEIQRLVEKSNTTSSLKMLQASLDKKAEFDLADYDDVLKKVYGGSAPEPKVEKTASERTWHLPSLRQNQEKDTASARVTFPVLEKTASERTDPPRKQVFTLTQKVETLQRQKMAAEMTIQERADYLVSEFSRMRGPDFGKFANEVFTLYGPKSGPLLQSLARNLREPADFSKVASLVDDTTKIHQAFSTAQTTLETLIKVGSELGRVKTELDEAWKALGK
jgi:hypothetical protein